MKYMIMVAVLSMGVIACTDEPRPKITKEMVVHSPSSTIRFTYSCEYNKYSCNANTMRNERTVVLSDTPSYSCDLAGNLHTLHYASASSKAGVAITQVKDTTCTYNVTMEPVK